MRRPALLAILLLARAAPAATPEVTAGDLPRVPPTEPDAALTTFTVKDGFTLELAAHEPLVADPVAVAFDARGHLFVVEMRGYSERREAALGRVRRLSDTDGDGTYDHATTYMDGLKWPTGIACHDGGVFVAASPDILYLKDTDGDGQADQRETVFTGFGSPSRRLNVQALLNGFRWGLDNRLYGATAANGGSVRRPDGTTVELRGRDFSFDPRSRDLRAEPGTAQFGISFDSYGRRFVSSNSRHAMAVIAPPHGTPGNPLAPLPHALVDIPTEGAAAEVFRRSPDEPWRVIRTRWRVAGLVGGPVEGGGRHSGYFTGATGLTVYTGDALGPGFADNLFIGDAGSNLVHRKRVTYADGELQPVASRPADEQDREFIASADNWFRPVSFANGPSGGLYILDMQREVIEHPWSLPDTIKRHLDLNSGNDRGRIYRVRRTASPVRTARPLADRPTADLVAALTHANGWHRLTAQRLLVDRADPTATALLTDLLTNTPTPHGRLHALYTLHGLAAVTDDHLATARGDAHPLVRAHGLALSPPNASLLSGSDPSPHVRFTAAARLASSQHPARLHTLLEVTSHPDDRGWLPAAALNAVRSADDADTFLALARKAPGTPGTVLERAARLVGRHARAASVADALEPPPTLPVLAALLDGLTAAGKSLGDIGLTTPAFQDAVAIATASDAPTATRLTAIALCRHAPRDTVEAPLLPLLASGTAPELQAAVVRTLAHVRSERLPEAVFAAWPTMAPRVRSTALDALLARGTTALPTLQAVDAGTIASAEIPARFRNSLRRHSDPQLRALATELFPPPSTAAADRVTARLADLDLAADPGRGKPLFDNLCASCHAPAEGRPAVGPDRLSFRTAGPASILTNLIDPNREVAPQYIAYTVTLQSGASHVGLVVAQDDTSLTLRQPLGVEQTFPRAQVTAVNALGTSLMPENLDATLTPQQLADLIAYLTRG